MNRPSMPAIPAEQRAYGWTVFLLAYATCLLALAGMLRIMACPEQGVSDSRRLFSAVMAGKGVTAIWEEAGRPVPGAHFYRQARSAGDGLIQFGLAAIGCTASAWGLLAAAALFARRRSWGYALLALWIAGMVFYSAAFG